MAQTPALTASYVLHAERPPTTSSWTLRSTAISPKSVLAVIPDRHAVLALVPQQNPHWSLSMLTGWETAAPHERTLTFDGYVVQNRLDLISGAMTPTPDGKSVLIRILVFHLAANTREVVALMVDLETFQVVWRHESTDPLIANSRWRFSEEGVLIAAEGPPPSSAPKQTYDWSDVITLNPASIGEHEAAEISVSDLKASLPCRYRVQAPKNAVLETDSCPDLLTAAGVTSAARLPGSPVGLRVEGLAGSLCDFLSVSEGGLLALYKCRTGKATNSMFYTTGREVKVLRVADGSVALSIHEPESEYVVAGLATAGGHDYLVRLHDGIKLEAYLLP